MGGTRLKHRKKDPEAVYGLAVAGAVLVLVGAFIVSAGLGVIVVGVALIYAAKTLDHPPA